MNGAKPILSLRNVQVAYGKAQALHDVSLQVGDGEVVGQWRRQNNDTSGHFRTAKTKLRRHRI
jgi:ABC-type lipopolysaccharide export system ATPase subunit